MLVAKEGVAASTSNGFHVVINDKRNRFSIRFLGNHDESFQEIRFPSKIEAVAAFALIAIAIADDKKILILDK